MTVKCTKCQFENSPDSKFCKECGTQLIPQEDIPVSVTKTLKTSVRRLEMGSLFAERYEILEELGKGGMGEVYRVKDQKLAEVMALKVLKPEIAADRDMIERFKNELKLARKIAHRNVCKMHDFHEKDETPYITMEYVAGEDLKSYVRRSEKLTPEEAISIAKQVCEGLAEAHELGVVHRDLKPQNIMIDEQGRAKIMDFGIARAVEAPGVTQTGVIIGTPDYISPEQAEGREADQRSDIYSLGVILYEMVTGTVPFKGDTALSVALKHKAQIPRDPRKLNPGLSENLSRLILICMEKDRARRYQTAEELLADLQNIEEGLPLGTKIRPRRATFIQTLTRKKLFIPASAVALAIITVVIWQLLPQREALPPVTSDKPSIAIMYFKNNTGEEDLDHWRTALSDLLTSDLDQSKYIYVLPEDRLYNIHKQLNLLEARSYSTDDLEKVAARGHVENVLLGSYSKAGENFRIDASIKKIRSGDEIRIQAVEGRGEESYFAMIDELTIKIKENLELSDEEIASDNDKEIGKITTSSPEAYKYYSEGRKYFFQGNYIRSNEFMEKAIAVDPEFAMAYRSLASTRGMSGYLSEKKTYLQKALEFADRLSDKERYWITGDFYSYSEKTYDKAIEAYKNILRFYPDEFQGITALGIIYYNLEEWDKAIEQTEAAIIHRKPENIGPYYNMALYLAGKGLYEKAREYPEYYLNNIEENHIIYARIALTYLFQHKYDLALIEVNKALSLEPNHSFCIMTKGDIYLLKGDLTNAEKEYQKILGLKSQHSHMNGRDRLRALYLLQGRFDNSEEQAQKGIELARNLDNQYRKLWFHSYLAYIYLKSGNLEKALQECNKRWSLAVEIEDLSHQRWSLHQKGLVHLEMNSMDEAQRAADELKETIDRGLNKKHKRYYYHLMGMIELKRNNFSQAIEYFKEAISLLSFQREANLDNHALLIESLALAYYKTRDLEKAGKEYEKIIGLTTGRLNYGDIYARSFYMLGKIYEEKGWKGKAIENYKKFLSLWKDADPGIEEVEDAKKRLAELLN